MYSDAIMRNGIYTLYSYTMMIILKMLIQLVGFSLSWYTFAFVLVAGYSRITINVSCTLLFLKVSFFMLFPFSFSTRLLLSSFANYVLTFVSKLLLVGTLQSSSGSHVGPCSARIVMTNVKNNHSRPGKRMINIESCNVNLLPRKSGNNRNCLINVSIIVAYVDISGIKTF